MLNFFKNLASEEIAYITNYYNTIDKKMMIQGILLLIFGLAIAFFGTKMFLTLFGPSFITAIFVVATFTTSMYFNIRGLKKIFAQGKQ